MFPGEEGVETVDTGSVGNISTNWEYLLLVFVNSNHFFFIKQKLFY